MATEERRGGRRRPKLLETRYFGFVIGAVVFGLLVFLQTAPGVPAWLDLERVEQSMLNVHFNWRRLGQQQLIQEGVSLHEESPNISSDILIVGVDFRALNEFGRWPFPRSRHADLVNSFARIEDQSQRERALFLDVFFIEPADSPYHDAILVDAIANNERVFLQTVLDPDPAPGGRARELFERHEVLYERHGRITNVEGDWTSIRSYRGLQPPLKPYGGSVAGYGHANFEADEDEVFRRQQLVASSSELIDAFPVEELSADTPVDHDRFERLAWMDRRGREHNIPYPLEQEDVSAIKEEIRASAPPATVTTEEGEEQETYLIRRYRDNFVPAVTLSLALQYYNRSLDDVEVVIGEHVRIVDPQQYDSETGSWEPLGEDITIPIDEQGSMLINFMGPRSSPAPGEYRTFPVRSYAGYARNAPGPDPETWRRTMAVPNQIVMVGAFAPGIADDELTTPFGLMYGIEVHANALNTILTGQFLNEVPWWVDTLILFGLVMLTAFLTARLSTLLSLAISAATVLAYFVFTIAMFDSYALIFNFSAPAVAVLVTFLAVVMYRVMTEERDKARIRKMFGKYVSPAVVNQILEDPPELGGVDRELTVFFSDIRGFTTLSETMTPQELVNHLNEYLTAMTDIILEYGGTLDKYVGDEIMAFWGAPLPQKEHAMLACKCAVRQMQALQELNSQWPPERRIEIGMGLNSGIMTVGNMGSSGRMNYTLMGDNVNLAARLEGTNKQYGTTCIISEYTYGLVKDRVLVRELDNIRVKGKHKPVVIYELLDVQEELAPPEDLRTSDKQNQAKGAQGRARGQKGKVGAGVATVRSP